LSGGSYITADGSLVPYRLGTLVLLAPPFSRA